MSDLLTTPEVADQLRAKPATVRLWATRGALRGFKVGRQWLFEPGDVDAFKAHGANRAVEPARRRRRRAT